MEPLNKKLYEQVKKDSSKKFLAKSSVYRSSWIVSEYKKRGGKYKGCKPKNTGLKRWYKEEWVDLNRPVPGGYEKCGRKSTKSGKYPLCRPLKKITKNTPKILEEISKKIIERNKKLKQKIKNSGKVKF